MSSSSRQYYYGAGKRKTAIARVQLHEDGSGNVTINNRPAKEYFSSLSLETTLAPLLLTDHRNTFDITISITGGGPHSQSEAARHGISKALLLFDPELRLPLKRAGFLRRDDRIRERKKPGLKRARRAPQWAKR